MDKLEITGGARVGIMNATWPLAKLKVTKDKFELNASIVGSLVFQPQDIISIKTYMMIPLIGQGIKINHRIQNYNQKVIFWTFREPSVVLDEIRQTGFLDNIDSNVSENDKLIIQQQQAGGFPIKRSVAIGAIVLWNVLFITDFINASKSDKQGSPLGYGAMIAIGLLLLISILSLISKDFSRLILKEGRTVKDINKFLYLLIFVSSFILIGMLTFRNA